jgi:hypothetical protein
MLGSRDSEPSRDSMARCSIIVRSCSVLHLIMLDAGRQQNTSLSIEIQKKTGTETAQAKNLRLGAYLLLMGANESH